MFNPFEFARKNALESKNKLSRDGWKSSVFMGVPDAYTPEEIEALAERNAETLSATISIKEIGADGKSKTVATHTDKYTGRIGAAFFRALRTGHDQTATQDGARKSKKARKSKSEGAAESAAQVEALADRNALPEMSANGAN